MTYYILILISDIFKNIPNFILQNSVYIFSSILIYKNFNRKKIIFNNPISIFILSLIITYCIALIFSLFFSEVTYVYSIQHFSYITIPLLLILYILNSDLSLKKIFNINRGLIITFIFIAFVGLIQNFFDTGFLSNRYSEIIGAGSGQVYRGIASLNQKFLKINSIFASPDRYSAVSQSIFLISIFNIRIIKLANLQDNKKNLCYLGILSSIFSLIIAGARSRIFTLLISSILVISFYSLISFISRKKFILPKSFKKFIIYASTIYLGIIILIPNLFNTFYESFGIFKLFSDPNNYKNFISRFVGQTGIREEIFTSDNWSRILYVSDMKSFSENIIGNGLGSIAYGKPGEAAIISTLGESGYILGSLILVIFFIISILIFIFGIKYINYKNIVFIYILNLIAVDLLLALITGLVYFFEPCHLIILYPTILGCIRIVQHNLTERNGIYKNFQNKLTN